MKKHTHLPFLALALLLAASAAARAQDEKFASTVQPIYLTDANGKPWADLTCQLRVKLDSEYTKELGADEVRAEKPQPASFSSGTWKLYVLEQDSKGTFARVNWVVHKNTNDPVAYQIGLYNPATRTEVPLLRRGASRVLMRNNAAPPATQLGERNCWWCVIKNNWVILLVVLLVSILIIYLGVIKFLFAGLLQRSWGAASAQYFTWVLSLALLLLAFAGWSYAYLGTRVETWVAFALTGGAMLLLAVVLAVAGTKQA